jgi:hypothetical protein
MQVFKNSVSAWLFTAAVGLAAFAVGLTARDLIQRSSTRLDLSPMILKADSAASNESFAMATGPIDSDVDGLFTLDFLTGELQCTVVNKRTGQLGGLFRANVVADLGVGQNTKYLMATGRLSLPRGGYAARVADSIVYVLDTNTGNFVAYGLPWRPEVASIGYAQASAMKLLGQGKARNVPVRE